jgi:hypothetical protein
MSLQKSPSLDVTPGSITSLLADKLSVRSVFFSLNLDQWTAMPIAALFIIPRDRSNPNTHPLQEWGWGNMVYAIPWNKFSF